MTKRIWELDALRGICVLGMVMVHLLYDLSDLGLDITSRLFRFVQYWGGTLFVLLSGICITLGSRHIRRGLTVFLLRHGMYRRHRRNVLPRPRR